MITEDNTKKLANLYKINESIIAREFIQITFLKELYDEKFSENIFFKGGTAIRLLYGGKRFSEDLDFTVQLDEKTFNKNIEKLFNKLENQYPFLFKEKKTITGKTYLLTATIPFLKSNVFVKLDFSMRENVINPTINTLKTDYPIIVQSFIHTLSKDELLAEKIRAIIKRDKHRDLYDLWILQELGAHIDKDLITKKLAYYKETFETQILFNRLNEFIKEEFIKDLRPFVQINERDKLGDLYEYVIKYLKESFSKIA